MTPLDAIGRMKKTVERNTTFDEFRLRISRTIFTNVQQIPMRRPVMGPSLEGDPTASPGRDADATKLFSTHRLPH
jgi:hypothetical protein